MTGEWLLNIDDTYFFHVGDMRMISRPNDVGIDIDVSMRVVSLSYSDKDSADVAWKTFASYKTLYHAALQKMNLDRDTKQALSIALQGKMGENLGLLR